jgi:hypothetical protein
VPIQGLVKFRRERDVRSGGKRSQDYESAVIHSPTWLTICVLADSAIVFTNDRHHVYLEGVRVTGKEDGVQIAVFEMGS